MLVSKLRKVLLISLHCNLNGLVTFWNFHHRVRIKFHYLRSVAFVAVYESWYHWKPVANLLPHSLVYFRFERC